MRTRIRDELGFAAIVSGPRLHRTEDLETAPALHHVRGAEGLCHPSPERVRSLAGASDEPEASAIEQVRRGLRDDPVHDVAASTDRRIAYNVIEGHTIDRTTDVPDPH